MQASEFDYALPPARIAQEPLAERDASRLLHVVSDGTLRDSFFRELPALLQPGDLLVANDTRVRHARLQAEVEETGHHVELLVLQRCGDGTYTCLTRPARRARPGVWLRISSGLRATVIAAADTQPGARIVRFQAPDVEAHIAAAGTVPLPPYIRRAATQDDAQRYQTEFASGEPRSSAAPTAGLHFTHEVLAALRERGVEWHTVQLDVGLGTFAPLRTGDIDEHAMHEERFTLPESTADAVNRARHSSRRVIAVGTTSMRVLETCADDHGRVAARASTTQLYIRPGFRFRIVEGLLTNFHQPRSTLLVLLEAFIGRALRQAAYNHALTHGYRFLSYGDSMLCWRLPS